MGPSIVHPKSAPGTVPGPTTANKVATDWVLLTDSLNPRILVSHLIAARHPAAAVIFKALGTGTLRPHGIDPAEIDPIWVTRMSRVAWRLALWLASAMTLSACNGASIGNPFGAGPKEPPSLARKALDDGSPDLALNICNDILRTDPHNIDALVVRGDAYAGEHRIEDAASSYRAALAPNPSTNDPAANAARIGLGRITLASDPAAAEAIFADAVRHNPRDVTALNNLGVARDTQGRHTEAQEAYRQAIAVGVSRQASEVNLALSLAVSGHAAEGEQLLQPLLRDPTLTPQMRQNMAAVAAMAHDRATATALLQVDLTPDQVRDTLASYDRLYPQ